MGFCFGLNINSDCPGILNRTAPVNVGTHSNQPAAKSHHHVMYAITTGLPKQPYLGSEPSLPDLTELLGQILDPNASSGT